VAVPDPLMLVLLILPQTRPFGTMSVKATLAINPLSAVTVMVVVLDCPALTAAGVEAVRVKSGVFTVYVATAECDRDPLVPVTIRG